MADIVQFQLNELELPQYNLSDNEKDRIVLALQGKAVQNPVQDSIDALRESIDQVETDLSTYGFTSGEENTITQRLNTLSTELNKLETHTNILSGVAINYTGFPPNFLGRLSIANSYNAIREALRKTEDGPCGIEEDKVEIHSRMFRSILGYAEQELEDQKRYFDGIDSTSIVYSEMLAIINAYIVNVKDFETQDDQAFFEAYNFVNKVSIAQALVNSGNDDFSKKLFDDVVGTQIFNTEDISRLKIQCQVWSTDTSTPPSDFSSNFQSEFALTSIDNLLDVDFEGWTAGNVLIFTTTGTLVPGEGGAASLELDDLENVSGAAAANHNDVLAWNSAKQNYMPIAISGGVGGTVTENDIVPLSATYGYNGDGTIDSITRDGTTTTYTYNGDGTINTTFDGTYTKTFAYNLDGTISSITVT